MEGRLGRAVAPGQAEAPVLNLVSTPEPVVGEAENHRARQPGAESRFHLPGEEFALALLAFADGIDAEFAQHQRLRVGEHLQSRKIIFEGFAVMQVNVEADKVDVLRAKEFGRRKRGERAEAIRVNGPGVIHQLINEFRHRAHTAPANDFRRNLVHDAVSEDRRVALAGGDGFSHGVARDRFRFL